MGNKLAYRDEVEWLVRWCKDNKLVLNTTKTNNNNVCNNPFYINRNCVERVLTFQFWGFQIEDYLI